MDVGFCRVEVEGTAPVKVQLYEATGPALSAKKSMQVFVQIVVSIGVCDRTVPGR